MSFLKKILIASVLLSFPVMCNMNKGTRNSTTVSPDAGGNACSKPAPFEATGDNVSGLSPCSSDCSHTIRLGSGDAKQFNFYSSIDITRRQINTDIKNVIMFIHGLDYNAENHYNIMRDAVEDAGRLPGTLVYAPLYPNESSARDAANDYYWVSAGWRIGQHSANPGTKINSFVLMDIMIENYFNRAHYPNLENIVIAGHSAGGQFVQRYAAMNRLDLDEGAMSSVNFTYIVANPSSYLYINPVRRPMSSGLFQIPDDCPGYDNYHYGLADIQQSNECNRELSRELLQNQFPPRKVTYFLGNRDIRQTGDESCSARLQGSHRLERGQTMFAFFEELYPAHQHRENIVAGVGHSPRDMFLSSEAKMLLMEQLSP